VRLLSSGRDIAAAAMTAWALSENVSDDNSRHLESPMVASDGCPRP
jgi:hypothetical protein